jgi:hypothetical protein
MMLLGILLAAIAAMIAVYILIFTIGIIVTLLGIFFDWLSGLGKPTPEKEPEPELVKFGSGSVNEKAKVEPEPESKSEEPWTRLQRLLQQLLDSKGITREQLNTLEEELLKCEARLDQNEASCKRNMESLAGSEDSDDKEDMADLVQALSKFAIARAGLRLAKAQVANLKAQVEARTGAKAFGTSPKSAEQEDATQKIQHLLNLAGRPRGNDGASNGNEAAAALEKAQELRPTSVADCGGTKLEISQNELKGITLPDVKRTGSRPQQTRVYVRHALCLPVRFVHHTCCDFDAICDFPPNTYSLCGHHSRSTPCLQVLHTLRQRALPVPRRGPTDFSPASPWQSDYQSNTLAFREQIVASNGELWQSLTRA